MDISNTQSSDIFPPKHHMEHLMSQIPPYELACFVNSANCMLQMAKKHPHVYMYILHKKFGQPEQMIRDAGFANGLPSYKIGIKKDLCLNTK